MLLTSPSPETDELVERLTREGFIGMREVARDLYPSGTHYGTPTRHATRGARLANGTVVRLEAIRVGGKLLTSRAAVLRFFAAQNQPAK